jgi:hypothetical protein
VTTLAVTGVAALSAYRFLLAHPQEPVVGLHTVIGVVLLVGCLVTAWRVIRWKSSHERLRRAYARAAERERAATGMPDEERARALEESGEELKREVAAVQRSAFLPGLLSPLSARQLAWQRRLTRPVGRFVAHPLRLGVLLSLVALASGVVIGAAVAIRRRRLDLLAWAIPVAWAVVFSGIGFGYAYTAARHGRSSARVIWGGIVAVLAIMGCVILMLA